MLEKIWWEKKLQKNFETKIFITKTYNNINECDTIFALLATFDKNREKVKKSAAYVLGIYLKKAISRSHCTQEMWLFQRSRVKRHITAFELSVTRLSHFSGICFIDDHEILVRGLPLRFSAKQLVPK